MRTALRSSQAYDTIRQAIEQRKSLTALVYHRVRHFTPHVLGRSDSGTSLCLGWQYAGECSSGQLRLGGHWLLFDVSQAWELELNRDPWTGPLVGFKRPAWIHEIDVQVPDGTSVVRDRRVDDV